MSTPATEEGTPLQKAVRKPETDAERQRRRELNKLYQRFKCPECSVAHADEYDAQTCCSLDAVYICPECDEDFYSMDAAQNCHQSHAEADTSPLEFNCCPVCKESQHDAESAIEHCLWKSMAHADRYQLLFLIRTGRTAEAQAIIEARKH